MMVGDVSVVTVFVIGTNYQTSFAPARELHRLWNIGGHVPLALWLMFLVSYAELSVFRYHT